MGIEIRKFTLGDIEELTKAFEDVDGLLFKQTLAEYRENNGEMKTRQTYVGILDGQIVGYVNLIFGAYYESFRKQGIPEINDLRVVEKFRRNGLAAALMERCENESKSMGFNKIGLGVGITPHYIPARTLYSKFGYKVDGAGVIEDEEWGASEYMIKIL